MSDFKRQLQESELTKVLADGLALLYHDKPKFPVTYLANYMKSYNQKKITKVNLIQKIATNKQISINLQNQIKKQKQHELQTISLNKLKIKEENQYMDIILNADNHEDLLDGFCNWVEEHRGLTGVYIGELQFADRKCDLETEDGQFAHLDTQGPKVIKLKNSSMSHRFLISKTLAQQSVSGKLVNQVENNEQGEGEQGEAKENLPLGEVYIPSVVGNSQLQFFKFPRLGAFFGVLMKVKTYLYQKCFDSNIIKTESFKKSKGEWDKEHDQKQAKFRELYDQKVNSGGDQKQLQQMQKQFQLQNSESASPQLQQFQSVVRTYVVGFDTLGQDREINLEERLKLKQYIEILKKSWEQADLKLLKSDIQLQLKLVEGSEFPQQQTFIKLIEEEDKQLASNQEVVKFKDNQKLAELQLDTLRIERLKQHLAEEKYLIYLDNLMALNIIKYPEIMQNFLYFLGNPKRNINRKGTNILYWRKSKKIIEDRKQFIQSISTYNPRGTKQGISVLPYAKWERLLRNIQKYDANTVASYNIYLAFLLRFLQIVGRIRKNDREQRLIQYKKEVDNRNQRLSEAQRKKEEKMEKMNKAKAQVEQKQQVFDEAAWELAYDEENPSIEVGEEIPEQIDEDLEEGSKQVINE